MPCRACRDARGLCLSLSDGSTSPAVRRDFVGKFFARGSRADWFIRTAIPHEQSAIETWNESFLGVEPDTEEKLAYFVKTRHAIDATRTDITTWTDLLDLEEQRHVPNRHATAIGGSR